MYKFGKTPPRALESFGVAGLLSEDCHVFYDSLYSPKHIGRVSDLISARLQSSGTDEFRLRTLLLYSLFEAYRSQISETGSWDLATTKTLGEPLVIECGIDAEKIAIGVAFHFPSSSIERLKGLSERIKSNKPQDEFEKIILMIGQQTDRLVLRAVPDSHRYEIVAVLGLPGQVETGGDEGVEVIVMSEVPEQSPKVKNYEELGDLDYPKLLQDDMKAGAKQSQSGEFLAKIAGAAVEESKKQIISGGATASLESFVVKGGAAAEAETVTTIKGQSEQRPEDWAVTSLAAPQGESVNTALEGKVRLYQEQNQQLQRRIAALTLELEEAQTVRVSSPVVPAVTDQSEEIEEEDGAEEEEEQKSVLKKFLEKPKFFKKLFGSKDEEDEEEVEETEESTETDKPGDGASSISLMPDTQPSQTSEVESASEPVDVQNVAKSLMMEIQAGGFNRILDNIQKDVVTLKSEFKSSKARKWVEVLAKELVGEKLKLQDMIKKLNRGIRQKDLEFQTKETALKEELKRRDEMVRQKNAAVTRMKDQLTQVTQNMEKIKKSSVSAASEAQYKMKYTHTSRMLETANEKINTMTKQVDELKNSLSITKQNASLQKNHELADLQKKYEKTARVTEDYRRLNKQLMEKVASAEKKAEGKPEEVKVRLDQMSKIAGERRKEIDRLKARVDELEVEKVRLSRDLNSLKNKSAA